MPRKPEITKKIIVTTVRLNLVNKKTKQFYEKEIELYGKISKEKIPQEISKQYDNSETKVIDFEILETSEKIFTMSHKTFVKNAKIKEF